MAASFLNTRDIEAALDAVGPMLGCRDPGELRDALIILENVGAVHVGLTWTTITIALPPSAGGKVIEIARAPPSRHASPAPRRRR